VTEPEEQEPDEPVGDETAPEAVPQRSRWRRFGVIGAIIGIAAAVVVPNVPRAQQVRLHLGPGSSRVTHLAARVAAGNSHTHVPPSADPWKSEGAWDRQATWRFDHGAPPSVTWSFELQNGEADIEIELASSMATTLSKRFHVELTGKETNVELGEAMRGLE